MMSKLLMNFVIVAMSSASVIFPEHKGTAEARSKPTVSLECVHIDECTPYAEEIRDMAQEEQGFFRKAWIKQPAQGPN